MVPSPFFLYGSYPPVPKNAGFISSSSQAQSPRWRDLPGQNNERKDYTYCNTGSGKASLNKSFIEPLTFSGFLLKMRIIDCLSPRPVQQSIGIKKVGQQELAFIFLRLKGTDYARKDYGHHPARCPSISDGHPLTHRRHFADH